MENITQKLHAHKLWLANYRQGERLSVSGADLFGAILSGANLFYADLRRTNLSSANLSGANLSDAVLFDANLSDANLSGANLTDANLSGADLSNADLFNADLSGANLFDANMRDANGITCLGMSSHGYRFYVQSTENGPIVGAGCRRFTFADARAHWGNRHYHDLRQELLARVDFAEAIAKMKGW